MAKNVSKNSSERFVSNKQPFTVGFRYKLKNGYTFVDMNARQTKDWQNFLNHVSALTADQVEKTYRRDTDTTDSFHGEQVLHYGFGDSFRVHGIIEGGVFIVLRLDPNHKFHH